MNIIFWIFLMVPTKECLDAHSKREADPNRIQFGTMKPEVRQLFWAGPRDEVPPVCIENSEGCYNLFVSSTPMSAVPFVPDTPSKNRRKK